MNTFFLARDKFMPEIHLKQSNIHAVLNEKMNTFFLARDKFMPEIHLKQSNIHAVLMVHSLEIEKE